MHGRLFFFKSNKKRPTGRFYFRTAQNNDHSHPTIDQPKTQLPRRTACISGLPLPFWRATHAGAINIPIVIATHIINFAITNISCNCIILHKKGRRQSPPLSPFVWIIYHIWHLCPVLLLCVITGYILPYGLYET